VHKFGEGRFEYLKVDVPVAVGDVVLLFTEDLADPLAVVVADAGDLASEPVEEVEFLDFAVLVAVHVGEHGIAVFVWVVEHGIRDLLGHVIIGRKFVRAQQFLHDPEAREVSILNLASLALVHFILLPLGVEQLYFVLF